MTRTPQWLDKEGKELYKRIAPKCKGEDSLLLAYCQAYAELRMATKTLQDEGRTITTDKGFKLAHPMVKVQKQAMSAMNQLAVKLGLDRKDIPKPNAKAKWEGIL